MQHKFQGLGVAMVTPFNADGTIDFEGLTSLTNHLIEGGVDYLVVQGTTGESATMTLKEKQDVLEHVKQVNAGRKPIVFGHGGNNTAALVEGFKNFNWDGVDAILSASPYYNKPTQEGIFQHYKTLDKSTPRPIIIYNVPGRTSSNITASTTVRMAHELNNMIAIKEASGDLGQVSQIIKNRPEDFAVISGDDPLVVPHIAVGGEGVISVIGNVIPKSFSTMVHQALEGDFNNARQMHLRLLDLIDLLFVEGNPGGIKAALKSRGVCGDAVRLPLVNVSTATYQAIEKELKGLQ
jgi:4-hydroxy-tetrahydrodipicolinate synthase